MSQDSLMIYFCFSLRRLSAREPWQGRDLRARHSLCAEDGGKSGVRKVLMVAGPSPSAVRT